MAKKFENMNIEELEAVRLDIAAEIDAHKAQFKSAGKALDILRAQTPEAKALKKLHEAREELAVIAAGREEEEGDN